MKRAVKVAALAIAGALACVYSYIQGVKDSESENVDTVTYPDGTVVTRWNGGVAATAEPIDEDEEDSIGADTQ